MSNNGAAPIPNTVAREEIPQLDAETARRLLSLAAHVQEARSFASPQEMELLSRRFNVSLETVKDAFAQKRAVSISLRHLIHTFLELCKSAISRHIGARPAVSSLLIGVAAIFVLIYQPKDISYGEHLPAFWLSIKAAVIIVYPLLLMLAYRNGTNKSAALISLFGVLLPITILGINHYFIHHGVDYSLARNIPLNTAIFYITIGLIVGVYTASNVGARNKEHGKRPFVINLREELIEKPYRAMLFLGIFYAALVFGQIFYFFAALHDVTTYAAFCIVEWFIVLGWMMWTCSLSARIRTSIGVSVVTACTFAFIIVGSAGRFDTTVLSIFLFFVAVLCFSILLIPLGVIASCIGGCKQALMSYKLENIADRQTVLAKIFECQERLKAQVDFEQIRDAARHMGIHEELTSSLLSGINMDERKSFIQELKVYCLRVITQRPYPVSIFAAAELIFSQKLQHFIPDNSVWNIPYILVSSILWFQAHALVIGCAYATARVSTGAYLGLIFAVFSTGFSFILGLEKIDLHSAASTTYGIGLYSFHVPFLVSYIIGLVWSWGIHAAIGAFGGAIGVYVQYLARQRALENGHQGALLAEVTRLHRRLSMWEQALTFLVVDVKHSTKMMANADSLSVEYSFNRYHRFVEGITVKHGGQVHSTAGDGVIAAFTSAQEGWSAACEMQSNIKTFNRSENRLLKPFQLRCGIHTGDVSIPDAVEQISFTYVIDVASHIEKVCPVGGIAMTDIAVSQCGGLEFCMELDEKIDGHKIYICTSETCESYTVKTLTKV